MLPISASYNKVSIICLSQAILLTSLYAPSDVVCCPSVDEMTRADDIFKQHHKMERTLRVVDNLPPSSGSEVDFNLYLYKKAMNETALVCYVASGNITSGFDIILLLIY